MSLYLYEIRQKQDQLRKKLADDEEQSKAKLEEEKKNHKTLQDHINKQKAKDNMIKVIETNA